MAQQQPQWSPPPQQPTGWGGGGYGGPPPRPVGVTLAAIYLIVMGVLVALVGGCVAGFSGLLGSAVDNAGVGGGGAILAIGGGFGIIVLALGIVSIVAGVGAVQGKNWGRITGIVISALAVVGAVLTVVGTGDFSGNIATIIVGVLYALCAWALIQANAYFSYQH
jgi:hypothetical protein